MLDKKEYCEIIAIYKQLDERIRKLNRSAHVDNAKECLAESLGSIVLEFELSDKSSGVLNES